VDDKIAKIPWTKRFLEWQEEVMVKLNIIYQDNTSTIKSCRRTEKKVQEKEPDISTSSIFT
jgi:hypothetical protein